MLIQCLKIYDTNETYPGAPGKISQRGCFWLQQVFYPSS